MTISLADLPVTDGLSFEHDGAVLTAVLDAPDGNLMTMAMCDALAAVLADPPPEVHVLVVSAAGEHFCLGRERTAAEYSNLLTQAGFRMTRVIATASPLSIVEAVPV